MRSLASVRTRPARAASEWGTRAGVSVLAAFGPACVSGRGRHPAAGGWRGSCPRLRSHAQAATATPSTGIEASRMLAALVRGMRGGASAQVRRLDGCAGGRRKAADQGGRLDGRAAHKAAEPHPHVHRLHGAPEGWAGHARHHVDRPAVHPVLREPEPEPPRRGHHGRRRARGQGPDRAPERLGHAAAGAAQQQPHIHRPDLRLDAAPHPGPLPQPDRGECPLASTTATHSQQRFRWECQARAAGQRRRGPLAPDLLCMPALLRPPCAGWQRPSGTAACLEFCG